MVESVFDGVTDQQIAESRVFVDSGVIRQQVAIVVAYARLSAGPLFVVARGLAGQEAGRAAFSQGPAVDGTVRPDWAKDLVRLEARLDLASLPAPVLAVEIHDDVARLGQVLGKNFQLTELCYENEAAFRSATIARRPRNRPHDVETQMFLAQQIARHFPVVREDRITEVALTMAATQAYRASELMQPNAAAGAIAMLDDVLAKIDTLPDYSTNGYARVSLLTAKWHASVALGDRSVFESCLTDLAARSASIAKHELSFTLHYNTVRSLVVLSGYRLAQGRVEDADALFSAITTVMAGGGERFTDHPGHVREFGQTCVLIQPIAYMRKVMRERSPVPLNDRPIKELRRTFAGAVREVLIEKAFRTTNGQAGAQVILGWASATCRADEPNAASAASQAA